MTHLDSSGWGYSGAIRTNSSTTTSRKEKTRNMDIKIGFADTARELVIRADGTQEELAAKINGAL
ncbi:DUF3107 family protein, partial [Corynebacterium striatum]|uniref:DUF3107 family protein n=1 Tax=Corynebacterium striatum TaxID=43770 RepID=UPI0003950C59